jgi:hypothetical protein
VFLVLLILEAVADTRRDIETTAGSEGAGCPPDSTPAHSPP